MNGGPRWNEEKEKEFDKMKKTVNLLLFTNVLTNLALILMVLAYFFYSMSR